MNSRRLVKKLIPSGLFPAVEPYGHLAEAVVLNTINGFPGKKFKVIGVTGTNGKTSTCYMIHRMLHDAGYKVGLMTTVAYGVGEDIRPQIHHMTNVGVPELMKRLKWMQTQGAEWLILETTSHALAQNRVWGVPYSLAVMTNVTHEHLDYHKTFERYRTAKQKLFKLTAANKQGLQTGVINADDPSAAYFIRDVPKALTYRIAPTPVQAALAGASDAAALPAAPVGNSGELVASQVQSSSEGSTFVATLAGAAGQPPRVLNLRVNIPGRFNISNALAAASAGIAIGLSDAQIEQGIAALSGVEGRMTTISEGQNYSVIVDFAHTPDSFEKLFKDLRPVVSQSGGRLIVLFGSAGRRDEAKRGVQGALAGKYADVVVVTEEDDRDIDGVSIMNQIAEGAQSEGKVQGRDLFLVHDRTEAINFAVRQAAPGDTVLLLGKGHEKTIERANGENPWDEIGTARAAIKALV